MADLENRLRYFVRNIVAVDKWPFRFGYSYRGGRGSAVLEGKSLPAERDVSAHCFSADLSTVTRENARVEIIFDVLSMDNRWMHGRISCLRGLFFFFFQEFPIPWIELFFIVVGKWKF